MEQVRQRLPSLSGGVTGKYPVVPVLVALALLGGCSDSGPSPGEQALVFDTADGQALEWASLRGEWVLVNYWAEWCKPCIEEIPELNRVDGEDGVTVLAVNFDGVQGEALRELGQRMGIAYTMLAENPAPAFGWEMPQGLPATFVVTPEGELREALMGAQTEAELMSAMKRD